MKVAHIKERAPMLKVFYRFFRSIKLASVLIVYLIGLTIVIGIWGPDILTVERGLGSLHAAKSEGRLGISLIVVVLPVVLFAINLMVCAVSRVINRIKAGSYTRRLGWLKAGPDLVHISILLFLIGGLLSHFGRIDGQVVLKPGQIVVLNSVYMIKLEDFQIEFYSNGRPRQYISSILLLKKSPQNQGHELIDRAEISVNNPYSMGRLKIYQSSFTIEESADTKRGASEASSSNTAAKKKTSASVLQAVYDPGYPVILAGILFFLLGLSFILTDKIRKNL